MPKVLRIINRFNLGGPIYNATYLAHYLAPEFETRLVGGLPEEGEEDARFIPQSHQVEPIVVPGMQRAVDPRKDYAAYKEIRKMIRSFNPCIVHTHASKAGALGRMAAFHEKVPIIVHTFHGHVFHSYFSRTKTQWYKRAERLLARRSNAIITLSRRQYEEICGTHRICPVEKARIIPLGFELDRFAVGKAHKRKIFRSKYNLDDDTVVIGIIGRLAPVKDHKLFLKALVKVKQNSGKRIHAFIVGDGMLKSELEALSHDLNLDDVVSFTGWERTVDLILPGFDILALTSRNEGTPVSLIEAQAAGIPIASTRAGGVGDVVCEDKTALLSDTGNVEQMAHNLLRLTEDRSLRHALSENGYKWVVKRFSATRLAADVRALYFELIQKNDPKQAH